MPDFSKRYNQNEIVTDYDAQRAAMAGRVLPIRHGGSRPSINTSKFETEYQNFIKKLKEQKAQEQAQEAIVETVEEPVVEAPKPKKKKSKVVLNDVITETSEEAEAAITEKVEEQPELPTFDLD
jgi:hypothetical protein